MVANPEVTPFWSYFLVGGDSPGTMDCGFQALNERIGDLSHCERSRFLEHNQTWNVVISTIRVHSSRSGTKGSTDSARCAGIHVATRPSTAIAKPGRPGHGLAVTRRET